MNILECWRKFVESVHDEEQRKGLVRSKHRPRRAKGMVACETYFGYRDGGGFSAAIVADGPWEAVFFFCGIYRVSPSEVSVDCMARFPNHEYTVAWEPRA